MGAITLPNVRATSDITVKVRLKYGGVPIDWTGLSDIKAWIYSDEQKALAGRCETEIDELDDTLLSCEYAATKPQYLGVNRIIVQAKYHGRTNTYDKPAFNIVKRNADLTQEEAVVIDTSEEEAVEVDVSIEITQVSTGLLDKGISAAFKAAGDADEAALRANQAAARSEQDHTVATGDHDTASADHAIAESDHAVATSDHSTAVEDHSRADADHATATGDHDQAVTDHERADVDHAVASEDHGTATSDHETASGDHVIATADHTQAVADNTQAAADHAQAGADHERAEGDHATADADHSQALIDHEAAESYGTYIDAPDYLRVYTDADGKILWAIKADGTVHVAVGVKASGDLSFDGEDVKFIEQPEFAYVRTDTDGRILYGVQKDGNFLFGCGVPSQVEKYVREKIAELGVAVDALLAGKVDKVTGKALSTNDFTNADKAIVDMHEIQDNPEFLAVETDADGRLLGGRKTDGTRVEKAGVEIGRNRISGDGDPEGRLEIKTDANGRIISYRSADGVLHENAGIAPEHLSLGDNATQELIEALDKLGYTANNPADWSDSELVEIPIPTVCAVIYFEVNGQAESKGADISTYIQYWDKAGNYFRKPVELNAQGDSSMNYHVKNQAIDLTDGSKIKFGKWLAFDSFHIKKYFIDVFRGQCIVCYRLAEQVYQTRPLGQRRPWSYLAANNAVDTGLGDFAKDFDSGALSHPDGFPVHVFFNGKDAGIYAFNMKKDRSNYNCKKTNQKQIILDGKLGETFWSANGDLTQPGAGGSEHIWNDFELRNPKVDKDIDGNKYDGDNPKEPSDDFAQAKGYIERLTTALAAVSAESSTAAKRAKFEEFFNVPFLIDYDVLGQLTYHYDGYAKNWIWLTNDGELWAPTVYDMDSVFGQHWNGSSYVAGSTTGILGNQEQLPTSLLHSLYHAECSARYKELRDAGIFSADNVCRLLEDWIAGCGYANLKDDIENIVTSPYLENGEVVVDGEGNPVLVPNTPSYRDGEKTYVYTPTNGGWYNSIERVRNWLVARIATLDTYYNYSA